MTLDELLSTVSSRELTEWEVVTQHEPLLYDMLNQRFAQLMAITVNMNRDPKKPAVQVSAFLRDGWETVEELEPEAPEATLAKFVVFAKSRNVEVPERVTNVVNSWRSVGDREVSS